MNSGDVVKQKITITGGAGFIGSNTAAHYLANGHQVVVLDNFKRRGTRSNVEWLARQFGSQLSVVESDIRHFTPELQGAVAAADVVFHLAAQVAVTTSVVNPREDFETNATGTFNVLEAARLAERQPIVVYASTNKVYGKMADAGVHLKDGRYQYSDLPHGAGESRPLDFYSPYGCSKGAGDQYVIDYARIFGLRTVAFRQSCIYGPRQFGIEDQGWVAWFAIRAMQGKGVTIFGDGRQVRDVLHVHDLIRCYTAAVDHIDAISGRAYNIGGGPDFTLSLLELLQILGERHGREMPCGFDDWRPGDQRVFIADIRQAAADFGWKPLIGPREGVNQLADWIEQNRELFPDA
jgi:CDP-paratose 2-epimerase